jgi:hypothetical protein
MMVHVLFFIEIEENIHVVELKQNLPLELHAKYRDNSYNIQFYKLAISFGKISQEI